MPTTRYRRYWDLHLTAADGTYDFVDDIKFLAALQGVEGSGGVGNQLADQRIFVRRKFFILGEKVVSLPIAGAAGLPPREGYVATAATVKSIARRETNPDAQLVINWINDPNFPSKIRVNVHGGQGGSLSMGPTSGTGGDPENGVTAKELVVWLKHNGLRAGGLRTINLSACFSSLDEDLIPNSLNTRGDRNSAIRQVADELAATSITSPFQIRGIEVTGTNESVNGVRRTLVVPTGPGWSKIQKVHAGFTERRGVQYETFTFQMEVTAPWTLKLRSPLGRSVAIAPAGAAMTPGADQKGEGPNSGWEVAGVKIPRKSNWLVFPDAVPDPNQPDDKRVAVQLAPGWIPDLFREVAGALRTSAFLITPGSSVESSKARQRIAQSTGKERVFS
jgi:hypothetical protein